MTLLVHKSQRGFSLVELMVAMALSLVLLAGVLGVLYSSKVTYSENERLARVQENARAAVEMILRDMRSGGFQGCGRPLKTGDLKNNLVSPTSLTHNYLQPLSGFEVGADGTATPTMDTTYIPSAAKSSDVVVIRGVRAGVPSYLTSVSMTGPDDDIVVNNPNGTVIAANTPMLISNCEFGAIFAASDFTTVGTTSTIKHETGGTGVANSEKNVGVYLQGSQVSPLNTVVYYVRANGSGVPSLWRIIDDGAPVELIQGVERLEIIYGEDTGGDGVADRYVPASTAGINWNRITNASISVLVRSVDEYGQIQANPTFQMVGAGAVTPAADRYLRTVFTSTATLRNRTP